MKHLRLWESYQTEAEVAEICKKYYIRNWSLNSQGLVDVDGSVELHETNMTQLPLQFGEVGDFYCNHNKLTSLKGSPRKVNGSFECYDNNLETLEYGPEIVMEHMLCCYNRLITLEGAPSQVGGNFDCRFNHLTTLEGGPKKVGGSYYWNYNQDLISLEGSPQEVSGDFGKGSVTELDHHSLRSLKGCPKIIGGKFEFNHYGHITSLEEVPQMIDGKQSDEWIIKHFITDKSEINILKTLPDYALTAEILSHVRRLSPEIYNLLKKRRDESQRWKTDLSADMGDLGF